MLASGKTVQVILDADIVWACLRATGRGRVIAEVPFGGDAKATVSGRFASLVTTLCDSRGGAVGCTYTDVEVFDVRRGRRTLKRTFSDAAGDDVYAVVDALVLSSGGGLATILRVGANREFWTFCPGEATRLQASTDVAPRLKREGRLVWSYSLASGQRTLGVGLRCARHRRR